MKSTVTLTHLSQMPLCLLTSLECLPCFSFESCTGCLCCEANTPLYDLTFLMAVELVLWPGFCKTDASVHDGGQASGSLASEPLGLYLELSLLGRMCTYLHLAFLRKCRTKFHGSHVTLHPQQQSKPGPCYSPCILTH